VQYPYAEAAFFWKAVGEYWDDVSAVGIYEVGTAFRRSERARTENGGIGSEVIGLGGGYEKDSGLDGSTKVGRCKEGDEVVGEVRLTIDL
jgi:hypothetical protein